MDPSLLWKSVVVGVAIAAPLGPIGALCVARTLERGFLAGVAGGLGTALADGTYAALAALGFAAFQAALGAVDLPLRLAGGAFMLWLGWRAAAPRRPGAAPGAAAGAAPRNLPGTVAATFLLTIANPATVLSFAAIFAGLGLAAAARGTDAAVVVAGVFAGSMLWWCVLSGAVALARHRLPDAAARWISRISGAALALFGLWALATAGAALLARA